MPSLSDVRVDLTGWTLEKHEETKALWTNSAGDVLSLLLVPPDPPDLPEYFPDLRTAMRHTTRKAGGGIVEFDPIPLPGLRGVHAISKYPQDPTGMLYVGTLTLSFTECVYMLKVTCPDHEATEARDGIVLSQMMELVKPSTQEEIEQWIQEHWFRDPYNPEDRSPVLRSQSEDPRYDKYFPDHPLSRARSYLAQWERTLQVAPALLQACRSPYRDDAPRTASQLLPKPRSHHYDFAHRVLPHLFLNDPGGFLGNLHQGRKTLLERFWTFVAQNLPSEEFITPDRLDVEFAIDEESALAVVLLPTARAITEAHLVGCHFWMKPPSAEAARFPSRYFTLELGANLQNGNLRTVLGEWNAEPTHTNHGDGPPHDSEAFIAAIRQMVRT